MARYSRGGAPPHSSFARDIMRRRRWETGGREVYETAKQWREADADVAEAIDYSIIRALMLRLSIPQRTRLAGRRERYFYEPRGRSRHHRRPWNFPDGGILCGMTAAAWPRAIPPS